MKISAIIENNYTISTTFDEAKKRGWIVGIGDNQLLKFIRDIKCIDFDKQIDKLGGILATIGLGDDLRTENIRRMKSGKLVAIDFGNLSTS